jgi:teichuronic acid exporter
VLSQVQDENERLKASISKLIKTVMYVSFIIMFGLAAIAHPLFSVLFGDKWLPSVPIFQFLCLAYAIAPMHAINHNILKVKGRSDLFLKTEILKYILFTPILIAGIIYGLKILVAGIVLFYWMGFFINALYSKKLINYSIVSQCRDFFPLIIILGVPAFVVLAIGLVLPVSTFLLLLIQITVYTLLTVGVSVLLKVAGFLGIVEILRNKFTVNNIVKTLKNTE